MWLPTLAVLSALVPDSGQVAKDSAALRVGLPLLTEAPVIDGVPNDSVWGRAAKMTGFTRFQPDEGKPGRYPSVAYVAYDADYLYVAFIANEPRNDVRGTIYPRERGGNADDRVDLFLDVFGDQRRAYYFSLNPH